MITTSSTRHDSNANWSCFSTLVRLGRCTLPVSASMSPDTIFKNVDLPAPFGPVTP
jgi:hypothetical protein